MIIGQWNPCHVPVYVLCVAVVENELQNDAENRLKSTTL